MFPDTLTEQVKFCTNNSLYILADELQIGDLIFTSTKLNGNIKDIDGVSIYVNENTVININFYGDFCFTKPVSQGHQVMYASPYAYLEAEYPLP